MRRRPAGLALLAAAALLLAACGGDGRDDEPAAAPATGGDTGSTAAANVPPSDGITDTEVKIGSSTSLSGPLSAYAVIPRMHQAYFNYVNQLGGVKMGDGKTRKVNFVVLDDGYEPPRAVENARRFVQNEKVFATFLNLGTPPVTATWDYYEQQKVPNVFVGTGAGKWGADPTKHRYTTGWQLAYPTEAAIWAEFLKREKPDATVAVLHANDDYGKDYLNGFKRAIEGSGIKIVAEQSYANTDPTVDTQVQALSTSGADALFNVTTAKFSAQAIKKMGEIGWTPRYHMLNGVSNSIASVLAPAGLQNSTGIYSVAYLKDASNPQLANDPGVVEFKDFMAKNAAGLDPNNPFTQFGYTTAQTMVKALEQTKAPTREALMEAVRSLDVELPLLVNGVRLKLGPNDGFPIEAAQLERFNGTSWELQGDVISYEGKTPAGE